MVFIFLWMKKNAQIGWESGKKAFLRFLQQWNKFLTTNIINNNELQTTLS